ncbi:hypothetical protein MFFC18_17140 [Mariniblastus fucicola]|uniref:Uncharacterized protein n=1 Tax=Mariniblastus fucicola TaxID=980251 RepID=A0A5B9PGG8_9BACT|nr:hypothetical protein MFFC18_17140 [Mariniblastus fucicola]
MRGPNERWLMERESGSIHRISHGSNRQSIDHRTPVDANKYQRFLGYRSRKLSAIFFNVGMFFVSRDCMVQQCT